MEIYIIAVLVRAAIEKVLKGSSVSVINSYSYVINLNILSYDDHNFTIQAQINEFLCRWTLYSAISSWICWIY